MRRGRITAGWCLLYALSICVLSTALVFAKEAEDDGNVDLLMDALDGEDSILPEGLDLTLEQEDDDFGQEEERSLEEFLEEEAEFFRSRDEDGSGGLSLDEFKTHFLQSVSEAGKLLPDPETGEEPAVPRRDANDEDEQHAEWAFREFDVNADGIVTWQEWSQMMFHEAPQEAEFVDGSPSKHHGDPHLKALFREWDKDQDGFLERTEVVEMFKSHRKEVQERGEEDGAKISDDEIEMVTWQVFDDKDADKDKKLDLNEWMNGEAYF